MSSHGHWCRDRNFWTTCKYCKAQVFFYSCTHGSAVFFDDVGGNWPTHRCDGRGTRRTLQNDPSGRVAWGSLRGVQINGQPDNHGLLAGLRRKESPDEVVARVKRSVYQARETMAMAPVGHAANPLVGVVTYISQIDVLEKHSIAPQSVGAAQIVRQLGTLNVTQLTVLVDDLDKDPAAIDKMSYTVWCPVSIDSLNSLEPGSVVSMTIEAENLWAIGEHWLVSSLEELH